MRTAADGAQPGSPFQEFFRTEAATGVLLFASACAALVAANSPWAGGYHHLWETPIAVAAGTHQLSLTLHQWINDGLMAVFFLLVGLELKREMLAGELASPRQAALPIAAALGGLTIPAIIYVLANAGGPGARGWAVPMATDIAFALGALSLAAPRAPGGLKVFLAALAIVDDMGAVLVIALVYTGSLAWGALGMAAVIVLCLVVLNLLHVRRLWPYLILGVALWFFVHESGLHATIAGIVLAFTIPTRSRIDAQVYSRTARRLLDDFDRTETGDLVVLTSKGQQEAVAALESASEAVSAPLLRLEYALHGFSAFVVMPLFAFSNAGVELSSASGGRVTVGIILGLVLGKPLGIFGASVLAVRLRLGALPQGVNWRMLFGCACLGGIGFTMSLFIGMLAFQGTPLLDSAKVGILAGSIAAGILGAVILRTARGAVSE
jgi:Na+:H+ antiporter, NhaA family